MVTKYQIIRAYQKFKFFFNKLPKTLAKHAFLTSLVLILVAVIFGAIVFYKYILLVEKKEPQIPEQSLIVDEKAIKEFLEIKKERQIRFDQADFKEYNNPFREHNNLSK